jgi:predicted membrane chloride channel (bestrophin family)
MVLKFSYVVLVYGDDGSGGGDENNDCNLIHLLKCFKNAYGIYDRKTLYLTCLLMPMLLLERGYLVPPSDGLANYHMDCFSCR